MNDYQELEKIFKILSVNSRLALIDLLKERPLCVNAIARKLGMTTPAVSQHLRILRDANLVNSIKKGNFVHYSINDEILEGWNKSIKEYFDTNNERN